MVLQVVYVVMLEPYENFKFVKYFGNVFASNLSNQLSTFKTKLGLLMSLSFNSSVSGIRAAIDMLSISAHNTANINTDGYKKQRVNLREDHDSGVIVDITESTEAGSLYQNKRGEMVEASNVNYVEEVVAQINARHLLSANAAAIKRTDDAQESLMDILAQNLLYPYVS